MTLYEINEALANIDWSQVVDTETGEILNYDNYDLLKNLNLAKQEKEINVALLIKNLRAEAEALNVEKNKLAKRERCMTK